MTQEPAKESRTGKAIAIVTAIGGVVIVIVTVLTFLKPPPPLPEFQAQVDTVCKSAVARQPQIDKAITLDGWNKDVFIETLASVPAVDRVTLGELRALRPPDVESKAQHASTIAMLEQLIADVEAYAESLPSLPSREWKQRLPEWPGNESPMLASSRQWGAAMVSLSGGRCQGAGPGK